MASIFRLKLLLFNLQHRISYLFFNQWIAEPENLFVSNHETLFVMLLISLINKKYQAAEAVEPILLIPIGNTVHLPLRWVKNNLSCEVWGGSTSTYFLMRAIQDTFVMRNTRDMLFLVAKTVTSILTDFNLILFNFIWVNSSRLQAPQYPIINITWNKLIEYSVLKV